MKFAVVGGDRRSVLLCSLLARDGHRVRSFALEGAPLEAGIPCSGCIQSCIYGADAVILPCPCEKNGRLHAPYASQPLWMHELRQALWSGVPVIGGAFSEEMLASARENGVPIVDLLRRDDFAVGNAALTAEGAIGLMIAENEGSLLRARVLVCGFGRVGRALAPRLHALGSTVTVAARSRRDRAAARSLGCAAVDYRELADGIDGFDILVNTVPARVLTDEMLCCAAETATLLELASAPYGFDRELAENVGLHVVFAPGLPGRYSPRAAAELMRDTVYELMAEREDA